MFSNIEYVYRESYVDDGVERCNGVTRIVRVLDAGCRRRRHTNGGLTILQY